MKKLIFLLFPLTALSQKSIEIPKEANTVVIKNVSFDSIVLNLLDNGFEPMDIHKDYGFLRTEWMPICSDCAPEIMLSIRYKDSTATISGQWRTNAGLSLKGPRTSLNSQRAYTYPLASTSHSGNRVAYASFMRLVQLVELFNHEITFEKR